MTNLAFVLAFVVFTTQAISFQCNALGSLQSDEKKDRQ
jgi:hypothetical protein